MKKLNGHKYIDLGLPSGTLWATCNVGAEYPCETGFHFAWGEIETKRYFDGDNYKFSDKGWALGSDEYDKYCIDDHSHEGCYDENGVFIGDGLSRLLPEDDVATVKWGSPWHIPTAKEFTEMLENCERKDGECLHKGAWFTSKINGETIFLPSGGRIGIQIEHPGGLEEEGCWYWTSDLENLMDYSWSQCLRGDLEFIDSTLRYKGLLVRPVAKIIV